MALPTISFVKLAAPETGVAVLLADDGAKLGALASAIDAAHGGLVTRAIEKAAFKGKQFQFLDLIAPEGARLAAPRRRHRRQARRDQGLGRDRGGRASGRR